MTILALCLFMGLLAGLRTMTPPAALAWAAHLGWLPLAGTPLGWLGHPVTPWVLSALALGELVTDKLPMTPSRKVPIQFGARLVVGGFCGAALAWPSGAWIAGLVVGVIGALIGTLGGAALRARLARGFGRDLPAALIEDGAAVFGAAAVVGSLATLRASGLAG